MARVFRLSDFAIPYDDRFGFLGDRRREEVLIRIFRHAYLRQNLYEEYLLFSNQGRLIDDGFLETTGVMCYRLTDKALELLHTVYRR